MALSGTEIRGLANTCGMNAANQIANAVADAGTPGLVNSSAGALQLGTNTTDSISIVGLLAQQAQNGVTAHAGGGQGSATALTGNVCRVSTVATAADSVKLPTSVAGRKIVVINDGANSMQVFGAGTDTINSIATATGIAQAAGTIVGYECTVAGNWRCNVSSSNPLQPAKFTTMNATTGTLAAGAASGATYVDLTSTNATPGNQAMRTVAQVLADSPALSPGQSYILRVRNTGAGTFTLTTDGSAQFTMTGTMTVLANSFREFVVTIATATTGTVQDIGSPADTVPVAGVAAGYKIARGEHTQLAASDTVVTGLATVVAVVVSPRTITVKQLFFQASPGDQAGTPAAGSILITSKKPTAVNDVTPTAATDFTDNIAVDWIAVGTAVMWFMLSLAATAALPSSLGYFS